LEEAARDSSANAYYSDWPEKCTWQVSEVAMEQTRKCGHPACHCQAAEGRKYCSPLCEKSGKLRATTCGCGHPECVSAAGTEAMPAGVR